MNKFKNILPFERPEIKIVPKKDMTFDIRINEVTWMYCDTRVGNSIIWGIYDAPEWKLTDCSVTKTFQKARIHGIDCVETSISDFSSPSDNEPSKVYSLFVHADEEQIQYVARAEMKDGVFHFNSLYDDDFIRNYSVEMPGRVMDAGFKVYKEDDLSQIHVILKDDSMLIGAGIFDVTIGNKTFECLRVIDRWRESPRILVENYMNRDGRSILFRRYNHPVWKLERYKQRWDEKLPEAKRLWINGEQYIHWYDCLSDIVFK